MTPCTPEIVSVEIVSVSTRAPSCPASAALSSRGGDSDDNDDDSGGSDSPSPALDGFTTAVKLSTRPLLAAPYL